MSIQDLGTLGEFFGSVAVLATLIYLSIQVRQAKEFAMRESESHMADRMADHFLQYVSNPDLGRIIELQQTNHLELDTEELRVAMCSRSITFSSSPIPLELTLKV